MRLALRRAHEPHALRPSGFQKPSPGRPCGQAARGFRKVAQLGLGITLAVATLTIPGHAQTSGEKPYVLDAGDQVTVQVADVEEFNNPKTLKIDEAGGITIPMVARVTAAGLTTRELEAEITTRLSKFIIRPAVTVSIVEKRTHQVTVTGAVRLPGVINVAEGKTLFEALAQAGGALPESGATLRLTRRAAQGPIPLPGTRKDTAGEYSALEIPIRDLEPDSEAGSLPVRANDVLVVSRAETIYVLGDVKKAGPFVLTEGRPVSVLEAIAMAEGTLKTAATSKASIKRRGSDDKVLDIPVDIDKIMAKKSPNLQLQAKDILVVPGSASKSALEKTISTILAIGTAAAIRF